MTDSVSHRLKALQEELRQLYRDQYGVAAVIQRRSELTEDEYSQIRMLKTWADKAWAWADALTPLIASEEGRANTEVEEYRFVAARLHPAEEGRAHHPRCLTRHGSERPCTCVAERGADARDKRDLSPNIWCDRCESWRYKVPCGRDDCPSEEGRAQAQPPHETDK